MKLNYKKLGEGGTPLIILHGLFGMLDNWITLGNRFAKQYTVYLVDQRNHGKSPHVPDITYPLMAADLEEFMQQQNLETAHLLGHSMGGKTAMEFSFRYPHRLRKLIIADIAPREYPPHHNDEMEALESLDLDKITRRQEADDQMALKLPDESTRQFLLKNLTRGEHGYRWKMNLPVLSAQYANVTAGVDPDGIYTGPVLFIKGERSRYIDEAKWPEIQQQFPNAILKIIPGAGHWVHAQAPQIFAEMVEDFIAGG